jgi:membrane-associated phospholipid phosphatase
VLFLSVVGRLWVAVFVAVSMVGSTALRLLVLNAIARPRPAVRLAPATSFSFPSGHTTESAAAALTALLVLWPFVHGRRRGILAGAVISPRPRDRRRQGSDTESLNPRTRRTAIPPSIHGSGTDVRSPAA